MALGTLFNGIQVRPGTLPLSALVANYAIPTANLVDGANFLKKDGSVTLTGNLNAGGNLINAVGAGVAATDAVNVGQLNALKAGTQLHFARVVSTTNISSLSGQPTIDGYQTVVGDVVFLVGQTTGSQNGPWVIASGSNAWTRPSDWASAAVKPEGQYFIIDADGTSFPNTKWFITNTGSITVDTTAVTTKQDLSGTNYQGDGTTISLSGTTFSAKLGSGLTSGAGGIAVQATAAGLITVAAAGIGISTGTSGQAIIAASGGAPTWTTIGGDATLSATGAIAVNNAAGSGFTKYGNHVTNEVLGGTLNGTNTAFTFAVAPVANSESVYYNGQRLPRSEYSLSGATATLNFSPATGESITGDYRK